MYCFKIYGNDFEVEFFDENNETIDVYTVSRDYLEVYWTVKDR